MRKLTYLTLLALVLLLVACTIPQASVAPTTEPTEVYAPTLVRGRSVAEAEFRVAAASVDECAMAPLVFDTRPDGHNSLSQLPRLGEGDFDLFQDFYKFKVLDQYGCMKAKPGERYWDMYGLMLECGAAIIQPQVYDEDGVKITDRGILAFLSWPGAEQFPVPIDPPYSQYGVAGFTENGDIGWAYGGESHIGPDGGPYLVWASSDPANWSDRIIGSDALDDLGWWDDHCEPSPLFRTTRKAGAAPPGGDADYALVDYDENGNAIGVIPFSPTVPLTGTRHLGLRVDGNDVGYVEWQHSQ